MNNLFWIIFLVAILVWYAFVTVKVAFRGFGNIKAMLEVMADENK